MADGLAGSFWGDIFQFYLTPDLSKNASAPVQVSFNSTAPHPEEGSIVWKHGNYYYLFISSGRFATCL
jgi:arabinan endo-1,5-alpha-L-arabinosidase